MYVCVCGGANVLSNQGAISESDAGCRVLNDAIYRNNMEQVRWLLDHDVQLNPHNNDCNPPLLYAIKAGNVPLTRTLIEAGADVNGTLKGLIYDDIPHFWSPLLVQCLYSPRPAAMVALLLSHKADVNAVDSECSTALSLSVMRNFHSDEPESAAIVEILLDEPNQVHSQDSLDAAFFNAFHSWYYDGDNMKDDSYARILLKVS